MKHNNIVHSVVHSILVSGKRPADEVIQHLQNCRTCAQALLLIDNVLQTDDASRIIQDILDKLPCDKIAAELHVYTLLDMSELNIQFPFVARHINECGECTDRFYAVKEVLKMETDGSFGGPIEIPKDQSELWEKVSERVYRFANELKIRFNNGIEVENLNAFFSGRYYDKTVTSRSLSKSHVHGPEEIEVEISPPTLKHAIAVRLFAEADNHVTISFSLGKKPQIEILLLSLYSMKPTANLIECRRLGVSRTTVRFERIPPGTFLFELKGNSGIVKIPFIIRDDVV